MSGKLVRVTGVSNVKDNIKNLYLYRYLEYNHTNVNGQTIHNSIVTQFPKAKTFQKTRANSVKFPPFRHFVTHSAAANNYHIVQMKTDTVELAIQDSSCTQNLILGQGVAA